MSNGLFTSRNKDIYSTIANFKVQSKEKSAENLAKEKYLANQRKIDEMYGSEAAVKDIISGGSGVIEKGKKLYTSDPRLEAKKLLETAEDTGEYSKLRSLIKPTEESKLLAAAQKERNTENELEKVVAKKKLGKVGKKEGSKVNWEDAGQKVAAGLISAAQEREKARISQDKVNRNVLRDQLELSNAASARRGQALSGLRTALANYFR